MACTCPSGTTQVSKITLKNYCVQGACTYGNTTYVKVMWSAKQISCQSSSGSVTNVGCDEKAGCCS